VFQKIGLHKIVFKGNYQAIPVQTWTGPEGSRLKRLPDFKIVGTWRWQVVGLTHWPPLLSRKYHWYSFLLAESKPQGYSASGIIISIKNSIDTIGNRTRDLLACRTESIDTIGNRTRDLLACRAV